MSKRDEIRNKLLAKKTGFVELFTWNGVELEFRTPTIEQASELQGAEGKHAVVLGMIMFSFIPGTDEQPFEDSDYGVLIKSPIDAEFRNVVDVIGRGIGLGVEEKVKNSE